MQDMTVNDDILLAPLETPPAYVAVVDRLRRAIALGVVLPGERLPSERTLAESLGVSRVTVREALRIMQGERLLVTKRGSGGTVVASAATSPEAICADGDYQVQVREAFEFRLAVEGMAARLAAERGTPAEIDDLLACQDALRVSSGVDEFRRVDSAFHLAIARMSRNSMLRRSVEEARAAAFAWLDLRNFEVFHDSSIRGHEAIIEAIERQAPDAAAEAMAAHIGVARTEVLAALAHIAEGQD